MNYQLVLQWPGSSLQDYDSMIETENQLIEYLSDSNEVDGHDIGSGEVNIFILTDNPTVAFNESKAVLDKLGFESHLRAAFRRIDEDDYKVLWPNDLTSFRVT